MIGERFIPTLAIVGHPNEGKSSVVSTLAEDDGVRISETPGETMKTQAYPVRVDGKEILRFVDTPGFQHPQRMLEWMQARSEAESDLAGAFIREHRGNAAYEQDLELLTPLAESCGVIYVVDGSRPVRKHDQAEMEILRLTGNPRMAVINLKSNEVRFLEPWKLACARCFNSTRVFNAVRATYAERMALLENLKSLHQDWEPALAWAIAAFREDWARRAHQVAGIICDLLRDGVTYTVSRNVFHVRDEEKAKQELVREYQSRMEQREQRAHADMQRLYKHNIFHPAWPGPAVLREDLFTEKTWQLLGLNRKQIVAAAAVLGAGAGVKLDLIFGHLTFGLFTVTGAALAAAATWLKGENMARANVKHLKLGGVQIVVGPNTNPQFPFVLLDRALLRYQSTINWAHARRESDAMMPRVHHEEKLGFASQWDKTRRKVSLDFLRSLTRGNLQRVEKAEHQMMSVLKEVLSEISEGEESHSAANRFPGQASANRAPGIEHGPEAFKRP